MPLKALVDLEIAMVKAFGWSLYEIDETEIESMMDFVERLTETAAGRTPYTPNIYCDQVEWL